MTVVRVFGLCPDAEHLTMLQKSIMVESSRWHSISIPLMERRLIVPNVRAFHKNIFFTQKVIINGVDNKENNKFSYNILVTKSIIITMNNSRINGYNKAYQQSF